MSIGKVSRLGGLSLVLVVGMVTACSSSSKTSTGTTSTTAPALSSLSASSFTSDFSAMKALTSLAAQGKGKVAAILPDTTSSTRYVEFDQPDILKALTTAGLPSSDVIVQNAGGMDNIELTDAQSDITNGATVLLMDPIDSGVGAQIESYAQSHGVDVVDYDRLSLGGSRQYYVSFNNVDVGTVLGNGLVTCISAWHVAKPEVVVMHGATTDNNATLFAQGYDAVLQPYFNSGAWVEAAKTAGTWDPPTAESEFQDAYTANTKINSALVPNDETGAPIVTYLQQTLKVKPMTFPLTGQDATLIGLQNVLSGYQCGTVYKPVPLEAQAAAALAIYLRAGKNPPSALVNGTTPDTTTNVQVPSILLKPEWVTPSNMNATIIKDNFVPAAQLCAGTYASDCTAAGITP